jgi:hypothetical protein
MSVVLLFSVMGQWLRVAWSQGRCVTAVECEDRVVGSLESLGTVGVDGGA